MNPWDRLDDIISKVEQILISILLSSIIILAFIQILLRNALATGLSWGDPLVRYLVLWVAFIGASMATREGKHIDIDVLSRWMTGLGNVIIQGVACLASFLICGLLSFAAWKFVRNEASIGAITFLGMPAWVPVLIIPIAFGLMTLRFGLRLFKALAVIPGLGSTRDRDTRK